MDIQLMQHRNLRDDNRKAITATVVALFFIFTPLFGVINQDNLAGELDYQAYESFSIRDGYYTSADGLSGEILSSELYEIIRNHTVVSYSSVWDDLRFTDEDPLNDSNVTLFYTLRSQSENETCGDGNTCTSQTWNREHVWPKSHGDFGTSMTNVAGVDLHALRPTDNTINSARNDKDFDNIAGQHSECTICNTSTDAWQAPLGSRGDAARAVFYMDIRYNGYGNEPNLTLVDQYTSSSSDDGQLGKLCTLYEWHMDDPVTSIEASRNERVYSIQANRNPFVDNQSFAVEIWGSLCDSDSDGDGWLDYEESSCGSNSTDGNSVPSDTDSSGYCDNLEYQFHSEMDVDNDNDSYLDSNDDFPYDPCAAVDTDGDGMPDWILLNCNTTLTEDVDDDDDGYDDTNDTFPQDDSEWSDFDADGIGNNADTDDDGDTVPDDYDEFPLNPAEWADNDMDGIGDNSDTDDDGDNWTDIVESDCGTDPMNATSIPGDFESDGVCDPLDEDDDNDSVNDTEDAFPFDALEWSDNDMDGIGDNSDTDDDGDNWTDVVESDCGTDPMNATSIPGDFESDGVCDPLDEDDDNDGANDSTDVWPYDRCASSDYDSDGLADELLIDCETVIGIDDDDDGDGVHDTDDGCPRGHIGWTSNPVNDIDGDGCHEIEDYDNDGDGFNNIDDSFPDDPAEWNDADQDGVGDNRDAFPSDSNETIDADGDGVGDNTDAYPNDSSRWNIVDNPVTEGIGDYIIVALAGIFLILLIALLIPLKKK
jgi:endonuclease I